MHISVKTSAFKRMILLHSIIDCRCYLYMIACYVSHVSILDSLKHRRTAFASTDFRVHWHDTRKRSRHRLHRRQSGRRLRRRRLHRRLLARSGLTRMTATSPSSPRLQGNRRRGRGAACRLQRVRARLRRRLRSLCRRLPRRRLLLRCP